MTRDDERALRLNRYLARSGWGSRRAVERIIEAGRVRIDGVLVRKLGVRVEPGAAVTIDGRPVILPESWSVHVFHKPLGVVCTLKAQRGQRGLAGFRARGGLPPASVPVGRLDADTTGLLLWTDDGDLAQTLCRPSGGIWKRYEVELDRPLSAEARPLLTDGGVELDGRPCLPARLVARGGAGRLWTIEIHEGRNRQVRRMFSAVGAEVAALHRSGFGPVGLGRLRPGCFRRLTSEEQDELYRAAAGDADSNPEGGT